MASFDIIAAAGQGYKSVWDYRSYLAKLCIVPVLVKMACYAVMVSLGWEEAYLRQALVMLPSYFADGWLLAHLVRLIFFGREGAADNPADALLCMWRGTAMFVVIRFLMSGVAALADYFRHEDMAGPAGDPSPILVIGGFAMILFVIWAFRFLWLYIPAAAGQSIRGFIMILGGYTTSLYMVGTWLICVGPLLFAFTVVALGFLEPFGNHVPAAASFAVGFVHVVMDTLINLISTAGIAYGAVALATQQKDS